MNDSKNSMRVKRIGAGLADSVESGVAEAGQKMISVVINDAATWVMGTYEKWKTSRSQKYKYEILQKYIDISNETIQIGMEKKEIAVMWAMRRLGYSVEKIQEVLDMANKAYLPMEEE